MTAAQKRNEGLGKKTFLGRLIQDLGLIVPLLRDYRSGAYGKFPFLSVAAIVFTVIYMVSPIDLIPDYIIGIGQIDDATVVALCLYLMKKDLQKYKEWKLSRERKDHFK